MADNGCIIEEKMTGPLVSVVVPCHNARHTIAGAVDSALRQDVPLEVVVIEDASDDGTYEYLQETYGNEPRVRVLRNEANAGAAASRNRGVREAKGEYIAFLDADDLWADGKLRRQIRMLEKTRACLCCTGRELLTPAGMPTGRTIGVKKRITYRQLLQHNSINCSSVVLPRAIAVRYPMEHEDSHEDYITWLKILRQEGDGAGIDEPLLLYRLSSGGKSGNKLKSAKMTFKVYRYMGFGPVRAAMCFISYAVHGVYKYLRA